MDADETKVFGSSFSMTGSTIAGYILAPKGKFYFGGSYGWGGSNSLNFTHDGNPITNKITLIGSAIFDQCTTGGCGTYVFVDKNAIETSPPLVTDPPSIPPFTKLYY